MCEIEEYSHSKVFICEDNDLTLQQFIANCCCNVIRTGYDEQQQCTFNFEFKEIQYIAELTYHNSDYDSALKLFNSDGDLIKLKGVDRQKICKEVNQFLKDINMSGDEDDWDNWGLEIEDRIAASLR